jgi:tetratricopeptide (TPR) repeat protein
MQYPHYKKPQIFYIEQLHNAQTRHAENHYLELLSTLGLSGFALFLWAAVYLLFGAYKKFKAYSLNTADARAKQRAYLLLAYAMALISVYIHNFADISLHLVSGGFFAAVFAAAVFNLSRGPMEVKVKAVEPARAGALFYASGIAALCLFGFIITYIIKDFYVMTLVNAKVPLLFLAAYWAFFICIICAAAYAFVKVIFKYKKTAPVFILSAAAAVMLLGWFSLKADNYLAAATMLAEQGRQNEALQYYARAAKYKPYESSINLFRGILLTERFDTARTNKPLEGDGKGRLYNDLQRAQLYFDKTRRLNPAEPLLYYHLGSLQRKAALHYGGEDYYKAAQASLKYALEFDPVFESIYFQLANLALDKNDYRQAYDWLTLYKRGPAGVTEPQYLNRHAQNPTANAHLNALAQKL